MPDSPAGTQEDALSAARERAAEEVVPVLKELVSRDTTIVTAADAAREDASHQEFVAEYLRELGAEVEVVVPERSEIEGHPLYQEGQTFEGRPIVWARFSGGGGGRSLLFNGHFDTVPPDPLEDWTSTPWTPEVRDGRLYGRGACDMKGGIAAALAAAAGLVHAGVTLAGDVLLNVVPFEEVNGMGTIATMQRGYRADAAVCCEPSGLDVWLACRGILLAELEVEGRSAHAEVGQPHHRAGGGVNAIDKLVDLLVELRRLNDDWLHRADKQHPLLSTPIVLPTLVDGGEFASNWPSKARATLNVCYMPGEADDEGFGGRVRAEVEELIAAAAELDSWLAEHPPKVRWLCDFPPAELAPDEPIVEAVRTAAARVGAGECAFTGLDSWADHVTLCRAGVPAVCFGPGSAEQAHSVDEFVEVDQLERAARAYVELAALWCGDGTRR